MILLFHGSAETGCLPVPLKHLGSGSIPGAPSIFKGNEMKVNLKKASQISKKALNETKNTINPTALVTVFSDKPTEIIEDKKKKYIENFSNMELLLQVGYEIRELISSKNNEVGISSLLTKKALVEEKISRYKNALSFQKDDMKSFLNKISVYREKPDGYYREEEFNFCFLDDDMSENFTKVLAELKKQQDMLDDQIAELNYSTKIILNDNTVKILKDNNIL